MSELPNVSFYLVRNSVSNGVSPKNIPKDCKIIECFNSLSDGKQIYVVENEPVFASKEIKEVRLDNDIFGNSQILYELTEQGAIRLEEVTSKNIGKRIMGLADGVVIINAVIRDRISGGQIAVSGIDQLTINKLLSKDTTENEHEFKELNLKNEPVSINQNEPFEVINAFFYYFCKQDKTYKKFGNSRYFDRFENLETVYSHYKFDKIEVEYLPPAILDLKNKLLLKLRKIPLTNSYLIRFYIGDTVYESSVNVSSETVGEPFTVCNIPY
ncbi:SecDF P1 head subdomain-containing protein [Treponema zioleckii]|uniref:SecDF P1 head subdomain-containing protein n=1 Tax=Treponema zioleckii TaxID=331680 RepID=UPI00168A7C04|nr:hypothetical protein [Treponema zioleckii]